jgi:nucleotide-binding universal stress UspA family protein
MFKNILVPLDGSRMAEAALPAAAFLAAKFNALVTLVHVVERNAPREIHGEPHLINAAEAEVYLGDTAQRAFPAGVRIDLHVHAAEVDNVAESIVAHAAELDHDMIVMCSHGRGRALHLFLGSIAQEVISKGSHPVLVTRPDKSKGIPEFYCRSLLLPLDGDEDHAQALPVSKELARVCGAIIHLAVAIPGFGDLSGQSAVTSRFLPGTISKILEISVENADVYLQEKLKELRKEGFEGSAHVLRGDPATVIYDSAQQLQIDLIVMATHGKSGMEAFWSGSVTNKMSSISSIPLLLIPVKKDRL